MRRGQCNKMERSTEDRSVVNMTWLDSFFFFLFDLQEIK